LRKLKSGAFDFQVSLMSSESDSEGLRAEPATAQQASDRRSDPQGRTEDPNAGAGKDRREPAHSSPRWYRQASVVVSIIALITSLGAAFYSNRQTARQGEFAARTELGQLVQRLSALPKENQELLAKYANDPATYTSLSGLLNQENLVLAQQAADVARRIPDHVSASECLAVAYALANSEDYARSLDLIEQGLSLPSNATAREGLLRLRGQNFFATGDPARGRAALQEALEVWQGQPEWEQGRGYAYTELLWAGLEKSIGNCVEVEKHVSRARDEADRLNPSSGLRAQVLQAVESSATPCE
jgi:tetratricopeptide (TPR) repeat protein